MPPYLSPIRFIQYSHCSVDFSAIYFAVRAPMTGGLTRWGICCASCLNPLFPLRTGLPSNTSPLLVWAARIANPGHLQPLQGNTITLAHPDERYMYTEMWKYSGKHRFHEMKCEASKINCLETHSHYHACLYPGRVCTKPLEGTSVSYTHLTLPTKA